MPTTCWQQRFESDGLLGRAFAEQKLCVAHVNRLMAPYLESPAGTPAEYEVRPCAMPQDALTWNRNIFSTLFHAMYFLLDCPEPRRLFYGRLLQLFRIWVTSADNLLDNEDKVVVPVRMPGESRIMRQVVTLMAADRVLSDLLEEAVAAGTVSPGSCALLRRETLRSLLPSAAQEATEEGGVTDRPDPEHVLSVIHRLKTGLLFNVAFVGPSLLEPGLDKTRFECLKEALMKFGVGCQILDDVRDLGSDLRNRRHNYVLSWLNMHAPDVIEALRPKAAHDGDRMYRKVPDAVAPAAARGLNMMREGLTTLSRAGLDCNEREVEHMARFMFAALDLPEMACA